MPQSTVARPVWVIPKGTERRHADIARTRRKCLWVGETVPRPMQRPMSDISRPDSALVRAMLSPARFVGFLVKTERGHRVGASLGGETGPKSVAGERRRSIAGDPGKIHVADSEPLSMVLAG